MTAGDLVLPRAALVAGTVEMLNRGGWGNPDVYLVATDGGEQVVVKDFAPRSWLVRMTLGRWLTLHELRVHAVLDGVAAVPRVRAVVDELAFALEYRPGTLLSRSLRGVVPPGFLAELEAAIAAMHARGVVHLDLRHRSNVLAGNDGHPVLIDFASAICFAPGGPLARFILPWLARIDHGALQKWVVRLTVPSSHPDPPQHL